MKAYFKYLNEKKERQPHLPPHETDFDGKIIIIAGEIYYRMELNDEE
ncbi:hypothetical protein UVI_02045660 [Ustilaginoidea virens]|uniref:Uncharacterized protein n=1 Tax=Ustilaginoidea virens TaxID=1159556 RepID=A0A1B5L7I9_USTVR|nr:hypothetical protein UVI_02045660 [Ustilaginoidea virens]